MGVFLRLWLRLFGRFRRDPVASFSEQQTELLKGWFARASSSGKPRGLLLMAFEVVGESVIVQQRERIYAWVPVQIAVEPEPEGELADVPQAREPRSVLAVFQFTENRWLTDGRTLFNLTPEQLFDREPGQYRLLSKPFPHRSE